MPLTIIAETPTSLPIEIELPVALSFTAKADPSTTQVATESSPKLDLRGAGVSISPFDSDGFAITSDEGENFEVALSSSENCRRVAMFGG